MLKTQNEVKGYYVEAPQPLDYIDAHIREERIPTKTVEEHLEETKSPHYIHKWISPFDQYVSKKVGMRDVTFTEPIFISTCYFESFGFNETRFLSDVKIEFSWFKKLQILNCEFQKSFSIEQHDIDNIKIENSEFKKEFKLRADINTATTKSCEFRDFEIDCSNGMTETQFQFRENKIYGFAYFNNVKFDSIDIQYHDYMFLLNEFLGKVTFYKCQFEYTQRGQISKALLKLKSKDKKDRISAIKQLSHFNDGSIIPQIKNILKLDEYEDVKGNIQKAFSKNIKFNFLFNDCTFENDLVFTGCKFYRKAYFYNNIFKSGVFFGDPRNFEPTHFETIAIFTLNTFNGFTSFEFCTFRNHSMFFQENFNSRTTFEGAEFIDEIVFKDIVSDSLNFNRITAKNDFSITDSRINSDVQFKDANMKRNFTFINLNTQLLNCTTEQIMQLIEVRKCLYFKKCKIDKKHNCKIKPTYPHMQEDDKFVIDWLHLTNSEFEFFKTNLVYDGKLEYPLIKESEGIELPHNIKEYEIASEYLDDSEFLLLKKSFSAQGMYDAEDWIYTEYRKYLQTKKTGKAKFLDKLLLKTSGYYLRPMQVFKTSIYTIIGFALLYFIVDVFMFDSISGDFKYYSIYTGCSVLDFVFEWLNHLLHYLYFSIIVFTTVGFGDISPVPGSFIILAIVLEALFGVYLMASFVTSLARKYLR